MMSRAPFPGGPHAPASPPPPGTAHEHQKCMMSILAEHPLRFVACASRGEELAARWTMRIRPVPMGLEGDDLLKLLDPAPERPAETPGLDPSTDEARRAANAAMGRYAMGDDEAFSVLYDAVAPRLYQFLLR